MFRPPSRFRRGRRAFRPPRSSRPGSPPGRFRTTIRPARSDHRPHRRSHRGGPGKVSGRWNGRLRYQADRCQETVRGHCLVGGEKDPAPIPLALPPSDAPVPVPVSSLIDVPIDVPIDVESLLVRCMHDADFAKRTLEKFHQRALDDMELLRRGVAARDIKEMTRLA